MGYTCCFVIKHREALIAIGQSDSSLAIQVLFLLSGGNPIHNSQAVFSLSDHVMITSQNQLWHSLTGQFHHGHPSSSKGTADPRVRRETCLQSQLKTNCAQPNYQKCWVTKSRSGAGDQHCLFCDTAHRGKALNLTSALLSGRVTIQRWRLSQ